MRRPHWRKTTWALVVWCVLILVWAVAGGSSASNNCAHHAYRTACNAGTAVGVAVILVIGFFGFVVLSLIWLMSRPRTH